MFFYGIGTEVEYKLAFECFEKSKDSVPLANAIYARMLMSGLGCKQNLKSAFDILTSAVTDDFETNYLLAVCFELGYGTSQNINTALKYYCKAFKIEYSNVYDKEFISNLNPYSYESHSFIGMFAWYYGIEEYYERNIKIAIGFYEEYCSHKVRSAYDFLIPNILYKVAIEVLRSGVSLEEKGEKSKDSQLYELALEEYQHASHYCSEAYMFLARLSLERRHKNTINVLNKVLNLEKFRIGILDETIDFINYLVGQYYEYYARDFGHKINYSKAIEHYGRTSEEEGFNHSLMLNELLS
jgi:TPR repeat protein